ncbi:putative transcriptional regulator, contains HTHdomain [Halalkaliarchaeum sp. AArc-CO]|uniref:DUF7351 domain-containing protein n=1 Tax=Halalkaliarchaeum sp. AArc-CO TaxID=2866381 RepID=UPI00217D94C5|nr:hypothetical protein [Halalkaliarchaeum sp. AArc-CO]UWG51310.1 putative transcriptional regulator, contains HTHdomain [Halalkaliarchaeum sp. AArc-CO]
MTGGASRKTYGYIPPHEALALLGSEIRAKILLTLSEARGGAGPPPILSFSELRSAIDSDVDSGGFNYHLQQLTGTFVERVEPTDSRDDAQVVSEMADVSKEGFRLRPEGTTLIRIVRAWTTTGEESIDPFEIGLDCYHCEAPVTAEYRNALFVVQCGHCEYLYDYNLTPPGILGGDSEAILDRVAEYNRTHRLAFARGHCPLCGSNVNVEFQDSSETAYPRRDLRSVLIQRGCRHCGNKDTLTVGETMLGDAELIGFCHRHGLEVTTTPIWELEFAATDRGVSVRSKDPWEVLLSVSVDGHTLELVVDSSLSVLERNRK